MKTCPFCEKGGIPLYVFREALVARAGSPVPMLPATFVKANPQDAKDPAMLVGRVLREGYLYVYDEVRKKLRGFVVAKGGYFYEFEVGAPSPALDKVDFVCHTSPADVALASCISIEHTSKKPAGLVHLIFSDVEWTAATIKKFSGNASFRAKNMRAIDLTQKSQPYAQPITQVDELIAEHMLDGPEGRKIFAHSPFIFSSKNVGVAYFTNLVEGNKAKNEIRKKSNLPPLTLHADKGLMVKLRDPIGVARELASMTQYKLNEFLTHTSRVRELALDNALMATEHTVRAQAWEGEQKAIETEAENVRRGYYDMTEVGQPGGRPEWIKPDPTAADKMLLRTHDDAHEKNVKDNAWKKYAKKIKTGSRDAFHTKFKADSKKLQSEWIDKLVEWHASWMAGNGLHKHMQANFDDDNLHQGFAYQQAIAQCCVNMSVHKAFNEMCAKFLDGDITDKSNVVLRALGVNNDDVINKIKSAISEPIDKRSLGTDNVTESIKEGLMRVNEAVAGEWAHGKGSYANITSHFCAMLAGPLVRFITPDVIGQTPKRRAVLLALKALQGEGMVVLTMNGSRVKFHNALASTLISLSGQDLNQQQVKDAVARRTRQLKRLLPKDTGHCKMQFLGVVDKNALKHINASLPANATAAQRAEALVAAVKSPDDMEKTFKAFDKVGKADVRLGIITGILQVAALTKAAEDEQKAMLHETAEVKNKLLAAWGSVVGTFTEVAGIAIGRGEALVMAGARGARAALVGLKAAKFVKIAGKIAGGVAGLIVAFWDLSHAYEEFQQREIGMMILYGASAVVGVGLAVGTMFSIAALTAWLPLLFVLMVVIIVLIEIFKDNKIQDWIERTLWGSYRDEYKQGSDPYASVEVELKEFEMALKG